MRREHLRREEALRKKQIYSALEDAALRREHLRRVIAQMSQNPQAKAIGDIESAIGRRLTDVERQRYFGVAPKELAGKVATKLIQDPASKTGWSFVSYDPMTGTEYSRQLDAPPQRGLIESETTTTDPLTGLTTVSRRKPIIGGAGGVGGEARSASPAGKPAAQPAASLTRPQSPLDVITSPPAGKPRLADQRPGAGPLARRSAPATSPTSAAGAPGAPRALPLDADGHIPASPFINPHVREAANELLDGQDKLKIQPSKLADAASTLARRYGWEQGKFTPKEQIMLHEATTFIRRAMSDGSMKALDEGSLSRLRLQQIAQNPDKEGFIGRALSLGASMGMSDSQKAFIQAYNQMVGTISGLSQLVRSGRATEATIERLKTELPNPTNTRDSKDAQERLQRLVDEINVALRKGSFTDAGAGDAAQQLINKITGGR